jgi:hypothetical protein
MAGAMIPEDLRRPAGILMFAIFIVGNLIALTLIISWVALLLSFIRIAYWPAPPTMNNLSLYFCLSLAMLCAMVWIGAQVEIVNLKETAQKIIGRSLSYCCSAA